MEIIFSALHTEVLERFRKHATAKLAKLEKLDSRAIRVDVEISAEHNPRQAGRKERVELTVSSRGPAIRSEAAAEDRYAALDMAFAKLESRMRRACDRRKGRHGAHAAVRLTDLPEAVLASGAERPAIRLSAGGGLLAGNGAVAAVAAMAAAADRADAAEEAEEEDKEDLVPVNVQGDGPLIVREKFHKASPMSIDQALFEMEMVGHDFFLFTDAATNVPSVVYRRRGYQYGVLRLIDERAPSKNKIEQDEPAVPATRSAPSRQLPAQRGQANGRTAGTASQSSSRASSQPVGKAASRGGRQGRQRANIAGR